MEYTHHELSYEIDDEWLLEAGALKFQATHESYRTASVSPNMGEVFQVLIGSVEPLVERARQRGIFCGNQDTRESARQRVVRILRWLVTDAEIEPVVVVKVSNGRFEYRLFEGCHRFHCANAMGFRSVPATLGPEI